MGNSKRWRGGVLILLASLSVLAFFGVAIARIAYPYELEWQEGGVLEHVHRVLAGEPLYVPPTLEFITFPYPPLYYWAAAAAAKLLGASFAVLRLVSLSATALTLVLLVFIGRRTGGTTFAGCLSAGLYAATFRWAGAWMDVARVDALAIFLATACIACLLRVSNSAGERQEAWAAGAALLAALAFLAKQTALVIVLPPILAIALQRRRAALVCLVILGAALGTSSFVLDSASEGWYRWTVYELLAGHAWDPAMRVGFWKELVLGLGPAFGIWLLWRFSQREPVDGPNSVVMWAALGGIVTAWLGRSHSGGYDNTLMPAGLAAAMLFGPAVTRCTLASGRQAWLVWLLAVAQFGALSYDPRDQLPSDADRAAGEELEELLGELEGEVFLPFHGYLLRAAGRPAGAHAMGIVDLLRGTDTEVARAFVAEFEDALRTKHWSTLLLDDLWDVPLIDRHYRRVAGPFGPPEPGVGRVFVPVTGAQNRPEFQFRAR